MDGLLAIQDGHVRAAEGRSVDRITIDAALTLELLYPHPAVFITVRTAAILEEGGRSFSVLPQEPATLGAVLRLFRVVLSDVQIVQGTLVLSFQSGAALRVPADNEFEAWDIAAEDRSRLLSTPGGEISVWSKPTD